ncbi:hypothetical protein ZIOFF_073126 [Zingiber officinale]|uniref:Uncharacterized protein n=1 Tax=Zingiber officinale TaxID=94328 RepID=A0A8J5BWP1_ZINOF|nr:hypothetical protein ZIOFF_073126 [Zingiber officinale]
MISPPTFLPKPSEGVRGGILGAPSSSFTLCSSSSLESRSHCRFGAPDFTLSPSTLYDVLGVAAATSGLEIMVAYWRLAGACHPDAVVVADRLTSSCGSTRPTRCSPTRTSAPSMIEGSSSPIGDGGRSILPDHRILLRRPTPTADVGDGPVLDMEAVRMAAIMSKNMEAVRMSERYALRFNNYDAHPLLHACSVSIATAFTQIEGIVLQPPRDPCIEKSGLWFHLKIVPCPLLALAIYLEVVLVLPYIRSTTDAKHKVQ